MNELTVTVTGWVATEPKMHVGPSGVRLVAFRLASTPRYFDKKEGKWTDGQTEWFSVRLFRDSSITVQKSLAKGQPVIVHGRMRTHDWESDTGMRTELQLDATTVGHDLTLGTADFVRAMGDSSLGEDEPDPADSAAGDDESVPTPVGEHESGDGAAVDHADRQERERQDEPAAV